MAPLANLVQWIESCSQITQLAKFNVFIKSADIFINYYLYNYM